ncbi:MAG: hypothetical protein NWF04_02525 [Candidatus Bathyarchaeota archaeon]|nr:hypothetical protein [Candidatus Bathyarchaeota archaeon]
MVDKAELLKWSRKYDKANGWLVQKEQALGAKFRKNKALTREDLVQVVEWKLGENSKKQRVLEAVAKNDEAEVARITGQVFNVVGTQDAYRINSLTTLDGVSPVMASVILTFFDPQNYGIFDAPAWQALLGNPPQNLFTTQNYLRLLTSLRKTAHKHNLSARTIQKAFHQKNLTK